MANQRLGDEIQGRLSVKTHLLQLYTSDPEEAPRLISEIHDQGTPILVIVEQPYCFWCKMNVPEGMIALEQVWGRDNGLMAPGWYCCYPYWRRIAVLISRNTIRFNCPIEHVPTKDNVMVSLDVGVNFHIGRSERDFEEDAKKFFYNFGANRLEELLKEEVDERIRDFIKKTRVNRVKDVRSELTFEILENLKGKFDIYGVVIEQVNVMNVIIPSDLRGYLTQTTNYDVFLQKQVQEKYYRLLLISNNENKATLQLKRDNMQTLFQFQHNKDVEGINLMCTEVEQETNQIIRQIGALKNQATRLLEAENKKNLAKIRSDAAATKITQEALAHQKQMQILADTQAQIIKQNAETRLEVAKNHSQALIKEVQAESAQQSNMEGMRRQEEKLGLVQALSNPKAKMVVSGKNAHNILDFYNQTLDQIAQR